MQQQQHASYRRTSGRLASGLGWFSIGLGVAEVAAPRRIARLIGVPPSDRTQAVIRTMGAREIAHGIAILSRPERPGPVWTRVGGDALDLSLLGAALRSGSTHRARAAAATAAVMGVTAVDVLCAARLAREDGRARVDRGVRVHASTTINRPITEVYAFWREFQNLPTFMRHLDSVDTLDERRSLWRAKAPAGTVIEWEAEIVGEAANEWIAWRSVEGSDVDNSGSVRFEHAPGARGTEVHVELHYHPPAGAVGRAILKMLGEDPAQQVRDDLRRFKQILETGEIPISDGPGLLRPAQPPRRADEVRSLTGVTQ